jgi:hypothetical protein
LPQCWAGFYEDSTQLLASVWRRLTTRDIQQLGDTSRGLKGSSFRIWDDYLYLKMSTLGPLSLEILEKLPVLRLWVAQILTCLVFTRCLQGPTLALWQLFPDNSKDR